MPPILQLDLQQIVSQALGFLLLWWALKRYAWRPLLAVLDARRKHIEDGFNEIARSKDELSRLQQELSSRLAKIDDEARLKIQQAILEGKRIAVEVQEEARNQAQAILEKSKDTIALELAKAKISLRNDMADMTIDAVERLLRQKLDAKADEALVASILDELTEPAKRQAAAGAGSH